MVGMGGYASLPAVAAARLSGIPSVVHEQNAAAGLANVVGARLTANVSLAFREARGAFPKSARVRVIGNPIRDSVATVDRHRSRGEAREALGLAADRPTLVVFGGSLGAARLNAAAIAISRQWKERNDRQLLVIAGRGHESTVREAAGAESARVVGFVERMELVYAAADLVLCRAGALTIAEVSAAGVPSVLVPYPHARRDHQAANARALAAKGGAVVVADADAEPERLGVLIDELLADRSRLSGIGTAARNFGRPHAARELAAWVLDLAGPARAPKGDRR